MTARSQDKRIWLAGGAMVAVIIAAIGWFGVISPKLSSTNTLRTDADSARSQNSVLEAKVVKLKLQNDNASELTATLRTALAALPFDSGLPAFTRQLSTQATQSDVGLTSITVGAITPVTATTAAGTGTATSTQVAIPVTLASTGTSKAQLAFLKAIQVTGPRRALVLSVSLGSGSGVESSSTDVSSTMTTQLSIFSAPLPAAARAQLEKLLAGK